MLLFACYIYVMIETALYYPQKMNKGTIEAFNTIMFFSEVFQMFTVGLEYFKHVENYIDLTGMLFMFIYSHF